MHVDDPERHGLEDILRSALESRARREGTVIVTVIAGAGNLHVAPGKRMLVRENGTCLGSIHPTVDSLFLVDAREILSSGRSILRSYGRVEGTWTRVKPQTGEFDVFFEVLGIPTSLIVVGAGHIALPLASIAKVLDFEVTIVDDRPEYANAERFPGADSIIVGPYDRVLAQLPITAETYIVLVTRGHVHDAACLSLVLGSPSPYIGMIGSKRRVRTVLDQVVLGGARPEDLDAVYAPVGLDIGSQTPAEIAVAIVAEMINVRYAGASPSLRAARGSARE